MFYLVTATIVMHNMMVEVRVNNDEDETENFYDISREFHILLQCDFCYKKSAQHHDGWAGDFVKVSAFFEEI